MLTHGPVQSSRVACTCQRQWLYLVPIVCLHANVHIHHKSTTKRIVICCCDLLVHTSQTIAGMCAASPQCALFYGNMSIVNMQCTGGSLGTTLLLCTPMQPLSFCSACTPASIKAYGEEMHGVGGQSKAYQALPASFLGQLSIKGFQIFV